MKSMKAFTLVEVIMVIVVILILAIAIVPKIQDMRHAATMAANDASVQTLIKAIDAFQVNGNVFTNITPIMGEVPVDQVVAQLSAPSPSYPAGFLMNPQGLNSRTVTILQQGDTWIIRATYD